uniref:Non-structural maintenance of chromosomes element 1 homolog n=1 Tax=Globisporangium ultimum (strain ATCC 200006 / CBS 805.95 / DAOM BR144) TaxID=431595 RepID=K3X684_GLOUD
MEEVQVRRLAKKLTGEDMSKSDVDEMVNKIAATIRTFALDVRRGVYDDGKMYVAIVNTSNDALTAFSSNFKPWEIVFLRKAIEEIVESEGGAVHEADLINLRENTTISEVHELIRKLSAEKWLAPSLHTGDSAGLTLGPRTYLELIAFLRDLEIKKCAICTYEMLQGVACAGDCETVLHTTCIDNFEAKELQYKCSECKTPVRQKQRQR